MASVSVKQNEHESSQMLECIRLSMNMKGKRSIQSVSSSSDEVMVSPASGKVMLATERSISIFMPLHSPHVTVAPLSGIIKQIKYEEGGFKPAFLRRSASNRRNTIEISTDFGDIRVIQIAGFFTRKIICYVNEGQSVEKGEIIGKICFGSRVDVCIPPNFNVIVREGERVKHGKTPIALKY
ncbi:MAG: Phosphatidylserine decarboxylase [Methanophagales archaeon]|nr:Phosphatidylserine decarboxylase [Methanophagales archaeon]